jgi:hypothetical protein
MVMAARHDGDGGVVPVGAAHRREGRGRRGAGVGVDLAQHRHQLRVARRGQEDASRVDRGDRDAQQPGDLGGHLTHPSSGEHDLHERPVRLLRTGEGGGLPVEDVGEHLVENVVETDLVGQQDQRKTQPVGLLDHLSGQLVQISPQFDRECGEAALVEIGHEAVQRLRRVAQRVAGGEQQLVRLHPGEDVGHLHDVEALHDAVEAALAGDQPGVRQRRDPEQLTHRHTVKNRSSAGQPHRRRVRVVRHVCSGGSRRP